MQLGLSALYAFLDACQTSTLTLATVIHTEGASYRKAGAMMLIDADMNTSGLVSGGCLEDDLKVHAQTVFDSGTPTTITYDLSHEEAASMWGLGLGCGGKIDVLLERIDDSNHMGGLSDIRAPFLAGSACVFHKTVASANPSAIGRYRLDINDAAMPIGEMSGHHSGPAVLTEIDGTGTLSIPISPVKRLLVCGAGPDAIPLVSIASHLDWQVVVSDPRPAYLKAGHFPGASQLLCEQPDDVDVAALGAIQAAVIMTHNVERDCAWLKKLHAQPVPYIGLLGPTARRDMLLERASLTLEPRLHGPAGLDIGATLPEEIALSIVAQMHASLEQRSGRALSALSLS